MTTNPIAQPQDPYKSELEILTALSEGKINISEAEYLLTKLKS
jgi:hypothetical protein